MKEFLLDEGNRGNMSDNAASDGSFNWLEGQAVSTGSFGF